MENYRISTQLSKSFLENKIDKSVKYIAETRRCQIENARRQIMEPTTVMETDSGNIRFVVFNMLGEFDGHYAVWVNKDTFDYRVKQHSYYGNLISVTPARDRRTYRPNDLSADQRTVMEGIIAWTLIKTSQYNEDYGYIDVLDKRTLGLIGSAVNDRL